MEAEGSIARLVRAFTFELVTAAGAVVGRLTSNVVTAYGQSRGLELLSNVANYAAGRLFWTDETVASPAVFLEGAAYTGFSAPRLALQDGSDLSTATLNVDGDALVGGGALVAQVSRDGTGYGVIFLGLDAEPTNQPHVSIRANESGYDGRSIVEIQAGNGKRATLDSDGAIIDHGGRQFLRSDDTRTTPQLVQHGAFAGSTDASGDIVITYDEQFTGSPNVVVSGTNSANRTFAVRAINSTSCTVRIFNAATGAVVASTAVIVQWIAMGAKNI